jgi:hypothetical protein
MATDVSAILDGVVARVQALAFTYKGQPVPVRKRKLTKQESGVDPLPHVDVYKSARPEEVTYFANVWDAQATFVGVNLVAPGGGDALADLDAWTSFRAQVVAAFSKRGADRLGIGNCRKVNVIPADFIPPDRAEQLYDLSLVEVRVETIEVR